jgi:rod shape-determining protein MreD
MRRFLPDLALSLLVLLVQTTIVQFLAIQTIVPDLVLLWIIALAVRRGQIPGTIAGFALGLIQDLISGPDGMLGLAALAKTMAGFAAGYFYNENKTIQTLGSYRFLLITAGVSALHNIFYFLIVLQGSGISWSGSLLAYGVPTTAYTVAMALIPMFAFARKQLS